MTRMEQVKALRAVAREAADSLEAAQRCRNHVWACLAAWDEMSNDERKESLTVALERLDEFVEVEA